MLQHVLPYFDTDMQLAPNVVVVSKNEMKPAHTQNAELNKIETLTLSILYTNRSRSLSDCVHRLCLLALRWSPGHETHTHTNKYILFSSLFMWPICRRWHAVISTTLLDA